VGSHVTAGESLLTVHAATPESLATALARLTRAVVIGPERVEPMPHIHHVIR
jgi:thymidine phosphorylase